MTRRSLSLSLSAGLTPLHAALLSHNAAVKELRSPAGLCSHRAQELLRGKQTYFECIRTLLLMGASCGAKVTVEGGREGGGGVVLRRHVGLTSLSRLQDLKSGRTCLHMASEEANVELLRVFLAQPSSPALVDAQASGRVARQRDSVSVARVKLFCMCLCFRRSAGTRRCTSSALCRSATLKWRPRSC